MRVISSSSPFGSLARTKVLLALGLITESYARELARVLKLNLSSIQKALVSLERDGIVAAREAGRTRLYRFSPRAPARAELARYIERLVESDAVLQLRVAELRKRPRRTGKPL